MPATKQFDKILSFKIENNGVNEASWFNQGLETQKLPINILR